MIYLVVAEYDDYEYSYDRAIIAYKDLELAMLHCEEANKIVKSLRLSGKCYGESPELEELRKTYDPELDWVTYTGGPDYSYRELELI